MDNGRLLGAVLIRPLNALVSAHKESLICISDSFVILGFSLVKNIYSTKRIHFLCKIEILCGIAFLKKKKKDK